MRMLAWLVSIPALAAASDWVPPPEGGRWLLPADSLAALRLSAAPALASAEAMAVANLPFERALRIRVERPGAQVWDAQLLGTTTGAVAAGDVLWLSMFVRGVELNTETAEVQAVAYLQRSGRAYEKALTVPVSAGAEWRQIMAPARAALTLDQGQHNFTLHLAFQAQTIDVGGITLINYGAERAPETLPRSRLTYPGAEPDAPWRQAAAENIEKLRKADLRVQVQDASGGPVAGAEVRAVQKCHAFGFGSAVAAQQLAAPGDDGDRYRDVIRTWFNQAVLENDLKWGPWEQNRQRALDALAWLRENGIARVRGHCLVWPGWPNMPPDVQALASRPEALRARILNHIADELSATRGQLAEWDVINEPYSNNDVQKILGEEEIALWFKHAREHEPDAVLYINDYGILSGGGNDRSHQDHYFNTIRKLIDWGAPAGGIGMQGHFGAQLTAPARVWQILDRFAQFSLQIGITEFDLDIDDEEVQAAYTRDFLTAVFSHPAVRGFMMWGFWEGRHWRPRAAMFRRDWSLKPNARAFHDLVFREWWTDVRGQTGPDGSFSTRGFLGDYEIQVTSGESRQVSTAPLERAGASVVVRLP